MNAYEVLNHVYLKVEVHRKKKDIYFTSDGYERYVVKRVRELETLFGENVMLFTGEDEDLVFVEAYTKDDRHHYYVSVVYRLDTQEIDISTRSMPVRKELEMESNFSLHHARHPLEETLFHYLTEQSRYRMHYVTNSVEVINRI